MIIPAFRARDTITRALASVAAQTRKPNRAIVVVDGSNDGTLEMAESSRSKMGTIDLHLFWQENQGAGAARNRALKEATATYVAFLDADDEWMPEKLARTMPRIENSENALVSHNILVDNEGNETRIDCFRRFMTPPIGFSGLYRRGYIATSSVVARRDAVVAAGGFDTSLKNAQDFDLWLAMTRDGSKFEVFDEWLTRNHITQGSVTTYTDRRLKCGIQVAERYGRSSWSDFWFRLVAIHYEAFSAHLSNKRYARATLVCLRFPFSLFVSTYRVMVQDNAWQPERL